MTNEPRGAGEVGDAGRSDDPRADDAAGAGDDSAEDEAPGAHQAISWLDVARARRDAQRAPETPMAEPVVLRSVTHAVDPPSEAPPAPAACPTPTPAPTPAPTPTPDPSPAPEHTPKHTPKHVVGGTAASRHVAPRRVALPEDRATDSVTASREVVGVLASEEPPAPEQPRDPRQADAAASRSSRRPQVRGAAPEVGPSLNVEFPPKLGARRVISALLLLGLVATSATAYLAYDDPRPLTLGGAGTLLVVTLALYGVRASSSPTQLAIRSGQLEVTRGKSVERFDLTSRFTRIEVVGRPGRPGWKVLLGRFGKSPLVITSSVVDAKSFTAELARYQPRH